MDRAAFERRVYAWLDGELPPDEAAAMEAFCAARPDCRELAERERATDARIRAALLSDARGRELVAACVARACSGGAPAARAAPSAPRAATIVRLRRWFLPLAAAASLLVGAMWVQCIPPFECPLVQALESAAEAAELAPCGDGAACPVTARMHVAAEGVGISPSGPAHVGVRCCCDADATAFRFEEDGAPVVCVWSSCEACEPSWRRRQDVDGAPLWVGSEHGRAVVAFRDPGTGLLLSLVAPLREDTLTALALRMRSALRP